MLTETNKQGIRNSVKQWSQRKTIPDEVLNDFIELAMSRANRLLRIPPLEAMTSISLSDAGNGQLPANFLEAISLSVEVEGDVIYLDRKSILEVDTLSNTSDQGYLPTSFARIGNYIKIAPWNLGDTYSADLYYYYAVPPMNNDLDTNWFTLYAPEVLLYGAMSELSDYVRDVDGHQLWTQKFETAVSLLQAVEEKAKWSGSTLAVTLKGSTRN